MDSPLIVDDDATTSGGFCFVDGCIGLRQQLVGSGLPVAATGQADAGPDGDPPVSVVDGAAERGHDPLCDVRGLRAGCGAFDDDDELVAAEPSDNVARAYGLLEPLGGHLQHVISGCVAV